MQLKKGSQNPMKCYMKLIKKILIYIFYYKEKLDVIRKEEINNLIQDFMKMEYLINMNFFFLSLQKLVFNV